MSSAHAPRRPQRRAAWIRLTVWLVVLGGLGGWGWWSMIRMPLKTYAGPWVPLDPGEMELREELRRHVVMLAEHIGERNVFQPGPFQAAADYIQASFTQAGYSVWKQTYRVSGETCVNLEAHISGQAQPSEILVVGAHYDSVSGCPGANDNGSAVAALLALARSMRANPLARTVRWVAFANEEPPFFQTEEMGSLVYARHCRRQQDRIVGMLSLETIGYYSDRKGSQRYPFPVGLFYPDTGNFIGFVGNPGSARLVRQCVASFRRQVRFPSEGAALPGWLPGIGWSDHWAFWQADYPAVMITDTAPFRYPFYHTAEDTPDKIDYDRLARVVSGLEKVIRDLAADQSLAAR